MESQEKLRDCVKALLDLDLQGWEANFIYRMRFWLGDYGDLQADKIVEIYDREV